MMKKLLNSFISRISNSTDRNESTFTVKKNVAQKANIEIVDLSYEDYMKYSSQQPRRKPTRLAVD